MSFWELNCCVEGYEAAHDPGGEEKAPLPSAEEFHAFMNMPEPKLPPAPKPQEPADAH
jgi:hypothetical protein